MKVLIKHLQLFLNRELDFHKTVKDLEMLGLEVEGHAYYDLKSVIVGKIEKINTHPNADKLQIADIFDGKTIVQVVCGADNIREGQLVPLALIGATLGELAIAKANIRGSWSSGMLCSAKELGLSQDHAGIYILNSNCQIGDTIDNYLSDASFIDLNITPNRPDWYSAFGVARELAAYYQMPLPQLTDKLNHQYKIIKQTNTPRLFAEYSLLQISGVKKLDTPKLILEELTMLGLNPKGNIFIDLTNWSTFVLGQPLHAFDAKKINGKIQVRQAKNNEKLSLINGNTLELSGQDTVISDEGEAVALAGIMGGASTGINNQTTDIYLEAASFIPTIIRGSVVRHGLNSDASQRFEKGVDPTLTTKALDYIAKLIIDHDPEAKVDLAINYTDYLPQKIKYAHESVEQISGTKINKIKALKYLQSLGYTINENMLTIPSWRYDINIAEDVAEDILRLHGLDNLPKTMLSKNSIELQNNPFVQKLALKQFLVENGFCEIQSLSFISTKEADLLALEPNKLLAVKNPTSNETQFLRANMLMGLLKTVRQNPAFKSHLLFEIGQIFKAGNKSSEILAMIATKDSLPRLKSIARQLSIDEQIIEEVSGKILEQLKIRGIKLYYLQTQIEKLNQSHQFDKRKVSQVIKISPFSNLSPSVKDVSFWLDNVDDLPEIIAGIYKQDQTILVVEQFDHYTDSSSGRSAIGLRIVLDPPNKAFTEESISVILKKIVNYLSDKGLEVR